MDIHRPVITTHHVSKAAHQALATGGTALVGINLHDAYFNPLNIFEIARWAAERFSSIMFICPDLPSIHTLRALGYSEHEAAQRANTKFNYLSNKCEEVGKKLGIAGRTKVLRWDAVKDNPAYKLSLQRLTDLCQQDSELRAALREQTRALIEDRRDCILTEAALEIGMHSILEEYALITKAQEILAVPNACAYIHHSATAVLDSLLEATTGFQHCPGDQVGTLICEVVWPNHSVTTLPKVWTRPMAVASQVRNPAFNGGQHVRHHR
jgi:cyclo(L-tyrosyl-L-tyrosyl) synthase